MKTTETDGYKCTVLKGRNSLFGYCKIQVTITKKGHTSKPPNKQFNVIKREEKALTYYSVFNKLVMMQ